MSRRTRGFPSTRPLARRIACPIGTVVSQGFRTLSRAASDVPHRRATRVLAESLGKPSLWVIINEIWYKRGRASESSPGLGPARGKEAVPSSARCKGCSGRAEMGPVKAPERAACPYKYRANIYKVRNKGD